MPIAKTLRRIGFRIGVPRVIIFEQTIKVPFGKVADMDGAKASIRKLQA